MVILTNKVGDSLKEFHKVQFLLISPAFIHILAVFMTKNILKS